MTTNSAATKQSRVEVTCSRDFVFFLQEMRISLALSTYQTNRLFLFGVKPDGRLSIFERLFDRAMGLQVSSDRIHLATRYQVWRLDNVLPPGEDSDSYDRLFVPRAGFTTGDLDIHDMALDRDGRLVFVNTLYSCLATLSEHHSFCPVWQPPFISRLAPEDRCHLNGLAMADGVPAYATAVSRSDVAVGWRDRREAGGCLLDIRHNEILSEQLSMPHSPRWYRDRLWLANSGNGEFGYFDLAQGRFEPVAFCPGYIRGLAFHEGFALVGLSLPRYNKVFSGLNLDDALQRKDAEPFCGLMVIDLASGNIAHWLRFEGGLVTELYDLQVLPGVRYPKMLGFRSDDIQHLITFPEDGRTVRHNLQPVGDGSAPPRDVPMQEMQSLPAPTAAEGAKYQLQASKNLTVAELCRTCSALTFPSIDKRAQGSNLREPLLCITANLGGECVGMAVAEPRAEGTARVISLFVRPEHRRRQVGRQLLRNLEKVARANDARCMKILYRTDWPGSAAVDRLLTTLGWTAPTGHSLQCKTTTELIAKAPWIHSVQPGPGFSLFPWVQLSPDERRGLQERRDQYPAVLSPFQEEERQEPSNSLGLRSDNGIVGWMITHRTRPDTIQYTSLYVEPSVRRRQPGIGISLLAKSICLQIEAGVPRGIFLVHMDNPQGLNLTRRHLEPYLQSMVETHCSRKSLGNDGAP
ncbi:MAG: TIGR03032 family protein [Desulfobulbaceae bacterium]